MDFVGGGWRSELKGLKLMQLHSRALDMGVEPEVVEEVSVFFERHFVWDSDTPFCCWK